MRKEDYNAFMKALNDMFDPKQGIVIQWDKERIALFDEFIKSLNVETLLQGPQYNYLKNRALYVLHELFNQNNYKINTLCTGIQRCMRNLYFGTYHSDELVRNAEIYRKKITQLIEEERKQIQRLFSELNAAIPGVMEKSAYAALSGFFDKYFKLSDAVLRALTEIQGVLETKGIVQRWVMFEKPAAELRAVIDGKKVNVQVHYSSDIKPQDVEMVYQQAQLDIFRGGATQPQLQKMKLLVDDLRKGGQSAKQLVVRIAQILLEILRENPKFIQAPEVTYHLLIRSQDRNWPSFAGACYINKDSTAEDVCLNIGQRIAVETYILNNSDLKGTIIHELGHMLDQQTLGAHHELNLLAKQLVGKDNITEFDIFLFEFFNMCRTEGYAEVIGNFHKEYDQSNPQEASFFFFDPDGYRKSHRVNYLHEFAHLQQFLEQVMNDKAAYLFQRYFQNEECIHLRYRFGYLLYLFTILGKLKEKNKDIVILTENSMKKFRAMIAKKDADFLIGLKQSNKKLVSFCTQYNIERISLGGLYKYWLESNGTVYVFRPAISDFDEIMTGLHNLQSHSLYLAYRKSCNALGIPRDKMIFSADYMSRIIRVTSRVQRMKSLQYKP